MSEGREKDIKEGRKEEYNGRKVGKKDITEGRKEGRKKKGYKGKKERRI